MVFGIRIGSLVKPRIAGKSLLRKMPKQMPRQTVRMEDARE
jgi:hypothetical protein